MKKVELQIVIEVGRQILAETDKVFYDLCVNCCLDTVIPSLPEDKRLEIFNNWLKVFGRFRIMEAEIISVRDKIYFSWRHRRARRQLNELKESYQRLSEDVTKLLCGHLPGFNYEKCNFDDADSFPV